MPAIRPRSFPPVPVGPIEPAAAPLLAPDLVMIAQRMQWRPGWTQIVTGKFSDSPFSGLLCYDRASGVAAFYETDGLADVRLIAEQDIGTSWTQIVVGKFAQGDYSALLLYDQDGGAGAFYSTDGNGVLHLLARSDGWRTSWTIIVPGRFTPSAYDGVLLYDQLAGFGAIYSTDGQGQMTVLAEYDDWPTTWTDIVPGEFYQKEGEAQSLTDLFFYEGSSGYGETHGSAGDGWIPRIGAQGGLPIGARVVSGAFGGLWLIPWTNLLFLDPALSSGQVWFAAGWPDPDAITWYLSEEIDLGGQSYDAVATGNFWVADADDLAFVDGGFTDLAFYRRQDGELDIFLKEPPPASIDAIAGYPSSSSVAAGETIAFHVSSNVGQFVIDIYRLGAEERFVRRIWAVEAPGPFPTPRNAWGDGAGWPVAASLDVPPDWASGLYIGRVVAGGLGTFPTPPPARPAERPAAVQVRGVQPAAMLDIPFVVRSVTPGSAASILVSVPDTTYEAYNYWGGRSLYGNAAGNGWVWAAPYGPTDAPRAFRVSFRRGFRTVDHRIGTDKWKFWEVPFLAWLERQQIPVEVCAVSDLHDQPDLLGNYRLFVSIGHDEYWSREMRTNVENFIHRGGNAAFLSGNTCYWQIRFATDMDTIICYKDAALDHAAPRSLVTVKWSDVTLKPGNVHQPSVKGSERKLTGVSGACYYDPDKPESWRKYSVKAESHWVFAGTGLSKDEAFGFYTGPDGQCRTVLGPETDFTVSGDTPRSFCVLAEMNDGSKPGNPVTATMVISEGQRGAGTVFSAATIDWVLGLTDTGDTPVDQITRNVLQRLG
jgi:hypothetical protein